MIGRVRLLFSKTPVEFKIIIHFITINRRLLRIDQYLKIASACFTKIEIVLKPASAMRRLRNSEEK